jgi:hypothetical protein
VVVTRRTTKVKSIEMGEKVDRGKLN